jgi:predicted transcriptional regulator
MNERGASGAGKTIGIIALIMFGIFIIVVYYQLEEIRQRPVSSCSCPSPTVTTGSTQVAEFVYAVYAELNHTNMMLSKVYAAEQPELAADLRYLRFEKHVTMRKSRLPSFRFRPLRHHFKEHYDELVERYKQKYPDDTYDFSK